MSPSRKRAEDLVENAERLLPRLPLGARSAADTSPSPSRESARRSAPCRRGRARGCPASCWRASSEIFVARENVVLSASAGRGRRRTPDRPPAPATPSISLIPGQTPPESCQPPPEPPSHSPRIARASTSRRSSSRKRPGERLGLAGRAHADADQRGEQIGRDGEPRAFRDVVDASRRARARGPARPSRASRSASDLPGAFDARRHDARGDHRGLEQAEVVLREVEDLRELRDVRARAEIDAHQPQHRLVDHAQPRLDRRLRRRRRGRARRDRSRRSARARLRDNPCRGKRCRSRRSA